MTPIQQAQREAAGFKVYPVAKNLEVITDLQVDDGHPISISTGRWMTKTEVANLITQLTKALQETS